MQARKQRLHTKRLCKAYKCKSSLQKQKNFLCFIDDIGFCETLMHKTYTRLLCNSRAILISSSKFFEESRRFWQQSRLHMNQRGKQRLRRTKKPNNFCFQVFMFYRFIQSDKKSMLQRLNKAMGCLTITCYESKECTANANYGRKMQAYLKKLISLP